ncbi:hypothetical protein OO012_19645 [Rhodobacteraceae bacterium KMM 6894]|nr:hypothetical protein [Rhodobacteraceae bacterium KMM 6894]
MADMNNPIRHDNCCNSLSEPEFAANFPGIDGRPGAFFGAAEDAGLQLSLYLLVSLPTHAFMSLENT